jgi:hypothetical protein
VNLPMHKSRRRPAATSADDWRACPLEHP